MARQDEQLTQAEIKHLAAQDQALAQAAQQEAARTAIAQQEQGTRAAAQVATQREGEARTQKEQELTPSQKLLNLAQAGAPEIQERANKVRAAVDLYQTMAQGKVQREQIQAQRDIEAGREKGALERQQEVNKSNVTDAMITHLATRPDVVDPTVMREALRRRGAGELADAYDAKRGELVNTQVEAFRQQLPALQKSGNLDKTLQAITDPDVRKQLQPHIDALTAPKQAVEEKYPGYNSEARKQLQYFPIDLTNLISEVANRTVVPGLNTVYGAVGAPPVEKAPILPRDYKEAWKVLNQ